MNGRTLALSTVAALAVAGFAARRRGSRAEASDSPYAFRTSMEQVIGGFPEGKMPLSKWRDLFLSRGVVQEQLDTRGFLSYLAERQRQGGKSLAKAEVIAWLAANPYGLLETWKGDFGVKTAAEQRANRERGSAINEAKRLLVAHGLSAAETDILLGREAAFAVPVGNEILRLDRRIGQSDIVALSPDGHLFATGQRWSSSYAVQLGRVADGMLDMGFYIGGPSFVTFSPDGLILAAGSSIGITLWRVADGAELRTLDARGVLSIAFSPDSRILAAGCSFPFQTTLWRVANGVTIANFRDEDDTYVRSVAFSPDGLILAAGGDNRKVDLWRVADGAKIATLPHARNVVSVAFSPNLDFGYILAAAMMGGYEHEVVLWRGVDRMKKVATLAHAGPVQSIAFSPDGSLLATGGEKLVLWQMENMTKLATLFYGAFITSLAFSSNGRVIATGANALAMLWRMAPNTDPLARALLRIPQLSSGSAPTWETYLSTGYTGYRELLLRLSPRAGTPPFAGDAMGSHWPEPDVLVHARLTLRPIKGKKGQALFADEIQSDWHQGLSGRKPHIDPKSLPPAPFADEWEKLMLKRLLLYAAETNVDALVLTNGATIAPLVDPNGKDHVGIAAFYDAKLVRLLESLVKGLGGVVEPISVKAGRTYKALPGVRMTDALRTRLGQGVGYWGRT